MKNINFKNITVEQIKLLLIALVIALSANYVSAWTGPTATAPGNNVGSLIDESANNQAKGGGGIVGGIKLDIDDATNINDVFSAQSLAVWLDATVVNDTYVDSLNIPTDVCADSNGTLVICP